MLLAMTLCLAAPSARAAWQSDALHPLFVCPSIGNSLAGAVVVSDSAGGALLAWEDQRNGNTDVYAQHVRADGTVDPAWPALGSALCLDPAPQAGLSMVPDGAGGAFVAWMDMTDGWDIHAQHVLAGGMVDPRWPANGQIVSVAPGGQAYPALAGDGRGGVLVAWFGDGDGAGFRIYTLRLLADGSVGPGWSAGGDPLCPGSAQSQLDPTIVADGAGGAIVAWDEYTGNADYTVFIDAIQAQHVLSTGAIDPAWPADGRTLSARAQSQQNPRAASDGAGGAIVTWQDGRGDSIGIFAQHVLAGGALDVAWPDSGRALCSETSVCAWPVIAADGSGGALVSWMDNRNGPNPLPAATRTRARAPGPMSEAEHDRLALLRPRAGVASRAELMSATDWDVYAHHVTATGALDHAWPGNGLPVCVATGSQEFPCIVGDGSGSAFIAWQDFRNDVTSNMLESDVYVQHVLANVGADPAWPANGRTPCAIPGYQYAPAMVGDGTSGVLFAYADTRADAPGLYAQHVLGSGLLGGELPVAVVSSLVDAGIEAGCARLRWSLQGAPGTVATLYRRTDRSDWRTLGRVDADGQGFVSCTDCDVSEETRYGYRLGIPASAGETFSQEAWVTTPASPAGLRLSVRNPVVGGSIEASFALPDPGPVAVELFDLSGRRVASTTARAIAGVQHVDLAPASSLEPGVYVLRVCLARPVCARIAVVR